MSEKQEIAEAVAGGVGVVAAQLLPYAAPTVAAAIGEACIGAGLAVTGGSTVGLLGGLLVGAALPMVALPMVCMGLVRLFRD